MHFWTIPLIGAFYGLVAERPCIFSPRYMMAWSPRSSSFLSFICSIGSIISTDWSIWGMVWSRRGRRKKGQCDEGHQGRCGRCKLWDTLFSILLISSLSSLSWLAFFAPFAAEVLAKNGLLTVAAFGKEREGLGSSFVKNSNEGDVVASTVLSLLLLAIPALLFMPAWLSLGDKVAIVSAALIESVIVGWVMSKVAQRNFGCVNGEGLGGDQ